MAHVCRAMLRDQQLRSPTGVAAWEYYQMWMTAQQKVVMRKETFIDSRFFNSFYKFAEWAIQVGIPDPKMFINFVVSRTISPTIWVNDEVYSMFIEYFDTTVSPMDQAKVAITTIHDLADSYQVSPGKLFEVVEIGTLVSKVRQRKLTPWVLLHSSAFKSMYVNRLTDHQRITLETIIRPQHWVKVFKAQPDTVDMMKMITQEMKI